MNNSKFAIESISLEEEKPVDIRPKLRTEEEKILKIVEAIRGVSETPQWSTLKTEIFDNLVNILEKGLHDEAKNESPDLLKLSRIAGKLEWAEKYADLHKLEGEYMGKLTNVRQKLYGKSESNGL